MESLRGIFSSLGSFGGFASPDEEEPLFDAAENVVENEPLPSPVGQDERRMQVRAYNHWASMLGERNFPAIDDLDPADLPDFGPYSVLLDFGNGIDNPAVRFLGDRLGVECGGVVSISRLEDVPGRSLLSRITDHYMQILANQAPIGFEAEFVNERGVPVLYRGILLPFSSDDETIDFIFGIINWKELADGQTADALLQEIDSALSMREPVEAVLDLDVVGVMAQDGTVNADEVRVAVQDVGVLVEAACEGEDEPFELANEADEHEVGLGGMALYQQSDVGDDELCAADCDDCEEEGGDEHLPSLMAMRMAKDAWRKTPAKLGASISINAPLMRQAVNAPMPLFEEHAEGSAYYNNGRETGGAMPPSDAQTFADGASGAGDHAATSASLPVLYGGTMHGGSHALVPPDTPAAMLERIAAAMNADEEATELHDCLASARELADAARNSEDRTRGALYKAIGRAYDVSLAASRTPDKFAELLAENCLTAQHRAPMTPIVKLVFGAGYDKTRVTEYAAALAHAQRLGVGQGELQEVLRQTEGGLKAIVAEERRLRRAEEGKPASSVHAMRADLAERLRALDPVALDSLPADGPEFALVMVRRLPSGELAVIGEVPEDTALVQKAARRMVG